MSNGLIIDGEYGISGPFTDRWEISSTIYYYLFQQSRAERYYNPLFLEVQLYGWNYLAEWLLVLD